MSFTKKIFINCPFDNRFRRLLHPLVFTCIYCELKPELSKLSDSGSARVENIISLIKTCKYSIHDLSRNKSKKANELARFNMPFELGLDIGVKKNATDKLTTKKCIVIDTEKHKYHEAISDLSGSDIASYGKRNQVENIIKAIRDWITAAIHPEQPPASLIYWDYIEFLSDLQESLAAAGFQLSDIKNLTNSEFIHYAGKWIEERKSST